MTHLRKFKLASEDAEFAIIQNERRTCFNGVYPLKIFPQKGLEWIEFGSITCFYGSNGSGKTTLLNIIGEKLNVIRHSEFSNSAFFGRYLECCQEYGIVPENSQFLSSDDVFDYVMNMRYLNQDIDDHREQLIKGYATMRHRAAVDEKYRQLHGLDDYDRWKEVKSAMNKNGTQSKFINERLARNIDMFSNGETALRYFTEHIDRDALYLLDEPENSLSIKFQLDLAKYIEDSARFYNCQFIISTHSPVFLSLKMRLFIILTNTPYQPKNGQNLKTSVNIMISSNRTKRSLKMIENIS